jgi:hypothetical protein
MSPRDWCLRVPDGYFCIQHSISTTIQEFVTMKSWLPSTTLAEIWPTHQLFYCNVIHVHSQSSSMENQQSCKTSLVFCPALLAELPPTGCEFQALWQLVLDLPACTQVLPVEIPWTPPSALLSAADLPARHDNTLSEPDWRLRHDVYPFSSHKSSRSAAETANNVEVVCPHPMDPNLIIINRPKHESILCGAGQKSERLRSHWRRHAARDDELTQRTTSDEPAQPRGTPPASFNILRRRFLPPYSTLAFRWTTPDDSPSRSVRYTKLRSFAG